MSLARILLYSVIAILFVAFGSAQVGGPPTSAEERACATQAALCAGSQPNEPGARDVCHSCLLKCVHQNPRLPFYEICLRVIGERKYWATDVATAAQSNFKETMWELALSAVCVSSADMWIDRVRLLAVARGVNAEVSVHEQIEILISSGGNTRIREGCKFAGAPNFNDWTNVENVAKRARDECGSWFERVDDNDDGHNAEVLENIGCTAACSTTRDFTPVEVHTASLFCLMQSFGFVTTKSELGSKPL